MTDDLVQRLRRTYRKEYAPTRSMCGDNSNKPFPFPILATEVPVNPDGHEAADRIEALTAENEALKKSGRALLNAKHKEAAEAELWFEKGQALAAEVERWRGMLEMVLSESVDIECGDRILYAGTVNDIRAALEKQP